MGLPFAFWKSSAVASTTFEFSVDTTQAGTLNTQFQLPLVSAGVLNFTIAWGDGNTDTITTYNQAETLHTYSSSGTYDITIDGAITGWFFNNGGDKQKLITISNWGGFDFSKERAFRGCKNLTTVSATDTPIISSTNMTQAFSNCAILTSIDVSTWDVSNVINISAFFSICKNLTAINCSSWDTSSATNMGNMFATCDNLLSLDLSTWDVSSVSSFNSMFSNSGDITTIGDISGWDVTNATNFGAMFNNTQIENIDLSSWNVNKVTNVANMFNNSDNFDFSMASWDIDSITSYTNFWRFADGLSTVNYDATLISWSAQTPSANESPNFGGSQYTLGGTAEAARNTLINTYGWTITDGGGI